MSMPLSSGEIKDLPHRKLSADTCRHYNYLVGSDGSEIAGYWRDGKLIGQKIRRQGKKFACLGEMTSPPLFGQHLWRVGGKRIVVTEGEIDCLTIAQAQDCKWPVVSLPTGAPGAAAAIKASYDFISSYDEVVLCFDNDDPGREAAKQVAEILPPGKAKIVTLPRKDANEMWLAGEGRQLITCLWEAQAYRPDGILHVKDVPQGKNASIEVWEFPWPTLTDFVIGQRGGEITLWTSGTGSGKSTIIRELAVHHLLNDRPVGMIMLEESPSETVDDIVSLFVNKPVRRTFAFKALNQLRENTGKPTLAPDFDASLTDEEYNLTRVMVDNLPLYIYDHMGSSGYDNLLARIEYMAVGLGCKVIILDHITAAIAGMISDSDEGGSERLMIDDMMKKLRSIVERTGVHLDIISQLRKPSTGKGYEEGARITLQDLRGSGSLSSVPNTVIALERDRQHTDKVTANTTVVRILKDRFTGQSGIATALHYNYETGRLVEVPFAINEDGEILFDPSATPSRKDPTQVFEALA
jgi:twinkle protein